MPERAMPQKAACRRPNSDVLAREREGGWGLLHVGPHSQPLAPSPGGAFLFGTSPRARSCPDAELSEIISALYPSKLGPVAAGAFFLLALFFGGAKAPPPPRGGFQRCGACARPA